MQILEWRPSKPPRVTRRIGAGANRLVSGFQKRTGRWPRTGIIHMTDDLKRIERIEFEPDVKRGP